MFLKLIRYRPILDSRYLVVVDTTSAREAAIVVLCCTIVSFVVIRQGHLLIWVSFVSVTLLTYVTQLVFIVVD